VKHCHGYHERVRTIEISCDASRVRSAFRTGACRARSGIAMVRPSDVA
jgi:hypothetical protein